MEAKEKSSSPAATAKGTAPSNYKYFSSLPPIFQVSDPQTKDEMKRGRAYDEGNQGEAYNPDYLYGGENYHKALSDVVSYVLRDCAGGSACRTSWGSPSSRARTPIRVRT